MRLHQLDIRAFGPFGGSASIDFDLLGEAGLFLLSGRTGAGKSSVLDAVCFGLYGVVPGARHSARQLRSDHADPGVTPEITLEFSVQGRRFRSRRSPAWQRPKRRGTGTTVQHASVVLEERRNDDWHTLATRLDEAGDLIVGLLGMQASQFTQVAMLPQGDFQRFLSATSDDRQAILQRLFNTDRFARIEQWLRDRRLDVARRMRAGQADLGDVLSRVQEAAGCSTPATWEDTDLGLLIQRGDIGIWCTDVADGAASDRDTAQQRAAQAATALQRCADAREQAVELAALQDRGALARCTLTDAAEQRTRTDELEQALAGHRRAQPVLAVLRHSEQARVRAETQAEQTADLMAAAGFGDDTDPASVHAALIDRERSLHSLREFLPRQREWDGALVEVEQVAARLAALSDEVPALEASVAEFPRRQEAAQSELMAAQLARGELARRVADLEAARAGLDAARRLIDVEIRCTRADDAVRSATTIHQDLRARHQDLREARINAMAGELAAGLAAGCSCPVCGSESHPAPASVHGVISETAERAAQEALDDAALTLEMRRDEARTLHHEATTLTGQAQGRDTVGWAELVADATTAHQAAAATASRVEELQATLESLALEEAALAATLQVARSDRTRLGVQHEALTEQINRFDREAARLLAGSHHGTVVDAIASLSALVEQLRAADDAIEALTGSRAEAARLAAAAHSEAVAAGFDDTDTATAADLGADAEQIRQDLDRRRAALSAAESTLADPAVHEAMQRKRPDLDAVATAMADAARTSQTAASAAQLARHRAERLLALRTQVDAALDVCLPLIREHAVIAGLADLAEGKSADNLLRMRLSAYVLSERLRGVVAAANDQLGRMGLDRFVLEQAEAGGHGERRGGLGLRVRDNWTSTVRATGTLSGGEGFMVSLALALGLAETVTNESGGTRIETLFIDEGFGSLDSEALEGVLDTLDSLRSGGRAVGVVSHVSEMRERIPTQLRVTADAHGGSSVAVIVRE